MGRVYKDIPGNPSQVFRGSVPTGGDLPSDNEIGDVWSVEDNGGGVPALYIWNGAAWTNVGSGAPVIDQFSIIATDNGTYPVADGVADTLTFTSPDATIDITGDQTTDTVKLSINNELPLTKFGDGYLDLELEKDGFHPESYVEPTYNVGQDIIQLDIWETPAKLVKIFQKNYTYTSTLLTKVEIVRFSDNKKLTKDIVYNGNGDVQSVTRTIT